MKRKRLESVGLTESTRAMRTQCATEAEDRSVCFKFREDYIECLHHKKEATAENEVARVRAERYAKAKEEMLKELWSFSWVTDPKYAPKKEGK